MGWRLVSDVGGTNVRFARSEDGRQLTALKSYSVSVFPDFLTALEKYFDETGGKKGCDGAAIGAAGPIAGGSVTLTNAAWTISEGEVSAKLGAPCTIINDVQAVAFALPYLSGSDFTVLGPVAPVLSKATRLFVANLGTGFGAATLIRTPREWICCPSEAGHMTLVFPQWRDERLGLKFKSVEQILCGPGLSKLRAAIANEEPSLSSAEVLASAGSDPHSSDALGLFTQIAGNVLGNLALAVAAWDGVFLCGSVARGFAAVADLALLRQALEDKGPMKEWMKRVPIALITKEDTALAGLASMPLDVSA